MKKTYAFACAFLLNSVLCIAQQGNDQLLVTVKNVDVLESISMIALVGRWYNVNGGQATPLQPEGLNSGIVRPNKSLFIEISGGGGVTIADYWAEDYSNRLRNTRWVIEEGQLNFQSSELGKLPITITRHRDSYDLYCNGFTYSRKIQLK